MSQSGSSGSHINPFSFSGPSSPSKTKYMSQFDVENWYHNLETETFKTVFIPLTFGTAESFIHHYSQNILGRKGFFTENDNENILKMTNTLDKIIKTEMNENAFVRLSTRSPKDAALSNTEKFRKQVEEKLKILNGDENEPLNEQLRCNNRLRAIQKASCELLKVSSGNQAMKLLLESERVFRDLMMTKECLEENKNNNNNNNKIDHNQIIMNVIVREYIHINPELEFRGFVFHRKLTAVTQYNDILFYPFEKDFVYQIVDSICSYWESISFKIPFDMCIVDFVILDSSIKEDGKFCVKIIEINPFGFVTGSSLFNWSDENDRLLIQNFDDYFGDLKPFLTDDVQVKSRGVRDVSFYSFSHPSFPLVEVRMNHSVPHRVNNDYVSVLFGDIFDSSSETQSSEGDSSHKYEQEPEPKKQCKLM